ncbi:A-kinase-interacting protein 1 isoform X2 [Triplophysa rosa]|uniref:A-kinase-interacting protein 1 isoform X2 n=1 Tax=Triplophysa rosa TaxID=992332 RepID=UPI002545D131|nr:A-kinase-interacting protein 1 isoform X2 [Triplophysa rosa]
MHCHTFTSEHAPKFGNCASCSLNSIKDPFFRATSRWTRRFGVVSLRRLCYMACESSMECSLRRSSKLGHDVLEKAKRRSINWPNVSAKPSPMFSHKKDSERNFSHANLDRAFATIVEYMAETTRQCKAFHKSVHQAEPNERVHICRYHCQDMLKTSDQNHNAALTIDRDFCLQELIPSQQPCRTHGQ